MSKPSIGSQANPINHLFVENLHTNKDFIPVGTLLLYSSNGTIPQGYLECNGAPVSRAMYPDLFALIGTTYGSGDGSTTFNLPDFSDGKFMEGSDSAGTVKSAGLPNVKGKFEARNCTANVGPVIYRPEGAFAQKMDDLGVDTAKSSVNTSDSSQSVIYNFDASNSNSIYSDDVDTVQPYSCTIRVIIKAFSGQTSDSALIDITQYANALNNKLENNLDNLNVTGIARNGFYRGKNLGTWSSLAQVEAFLAEHNVSGGVFDDLFLGDYVTIQDGTYNKEWEIAGFDHYLHHSNPEFTTHHIVLFPKENLTTSYMNSTDTTVGGYAGSYMHTTVIPTVNTNLMNVLGSHLLEHNDTLSNRISASISSMAGAGKTGASDSQGGYLVKARLASELEVLGSMVFSSSCYDAGFTKKLPIFNFKDLSYSRESFWLMSVASSQRFVFYGYAGYTMDGSASSSIGVRPIICIG